MRDITESCFRYPRIWRIGGLPLYTPSMVAGKYGTLLPPPSPHFRCGILRFVSCTPYARPSCAGWVTLTSAKPSGRSNIGRLPMSKLTRNCTSKKLRSSADGLMSTRRVTTYIPVSRHVLLFSYNIFDGSWSAQQADVRKRGFLDFDDFKCFVKLLKARPEVKRLYQKLCRLFEGRFSYQTFEHFMHEHQKVSEPVN